MWWTGERRVSRTWVDEYNNGVSLRERGRKNHASAEKGQVTSRKEAKEKEKGLKGKRKEIHNDMRGRAVRVEEK